MRQKQLEQQWINELIEDLPEYSESIRQVNIKVDLFFELLEDYFFCKQQMKKMMRAGNTQAVQEFVLELEALKTEISNLLRKNENFPHEQK